LCDGRIVIPRLTDDSSRPISVIVELRRSRSRRLLNLLRDVLDVFLRVIDGIRGSSVGYVLLIWTAVFVFDRGSDMCLILHLL
jgi:hypothetical protein